jgi:hypothetical protein
MEALVLLLVSIFVPSAAGVLLVRDIDQKRRDRERVPYWLSFPADFNDERVTSMVRSISGTLRSTAHGFTGMPTVCFEVWATSEGIRHRILVPWQYADYVVTQLRSLVPGIRITPDEDRPRRRWTRAVEVGLTRSTRSLRIYSASDMAASLLASMQALKGDETVIMQWVVTPAVPAHPPIYNQSHTDTLTYRNIIHGSLATRDEIIARREKLAEPNMLAVLRVAAFADTRVRADHLTYRVRASLAATRSHSTRFVKRLVTKAELQRRIDAAAGCVHFPIQLSAPELAALIAWPIGNPFVSGLPPRMARQLAASDTVPREGRVIGRSNFPGGERPVAVDYTKAREHLHVVGPTGSGKTVALANMLRQDIEHGNGVILIDGKGGASSLFSAALDLVPRKRIEDTIVLDVQDTAHPVGFNIMNQGDPRVVIDEITDLFESLYDTKSVWTKEVLYHGLRTVASDARLTFIDLGPLLSPQSPEESEWRDGLVRGLTDAELRQFWQLFENQGRVRQDQIVQPVLDRIWQLNARPELRHIIGQSQSSFQMADVLAQRKILLVNLGGLAKETASLTGTLIMNALWHAVKTTPSDPPTYLYLDEFQKFIRLPIDPESMLAEARGFGLGMTLAHQHLNQLPTELRQAVLANSRSKIVFQTTADDARAMSREFGSSVEDSDFMHLGKYEAIARVATGSGVSAPLTMTTLEPAKGYGTAKAVRYVSRQKYGRTVNDVAADIANRRRPEKKPPKNPPKIGGDWQI